MTISKASWHSHLPFIIFFNAIMWLLLPCGDKNSFYSLFDTFFCQAKYARNVK